MKVQEIQRVLLISRYRRNVVMPRFTPRRWFECDLIEVTPAGFWWEYEIKLSRADFRADAQKASPWYAKDTRTKHARLASGDPSGPNQFWFVAPLGVIPRDELPIWAGLIEVEETRWSGTLIDREVVKAPKRHIEKVDPRVTEEIRESCYYRFLSRELHASRCEVEVDFEI